MPGRAFLFEAWSTNPRHPHHLRAHPIRILPFSKVQGIRIELMKNNINGATSKWSLTLKTVLLACLTPQNFEVFKLGKITFGLGQSNIALRTVVWNTNRKASILMTRRKLKASFRISTAMHSLRIT